MTRDPSPLSNPAGAVHTGKSPPAGANLIIARAGGVTQAVVALPCLHAVARAFPKARRILLTDAAAAEAVAPVQGLLEAAGLIDATLCHPSGSPLWSSVTLMQTLRQLAPSALVCLTEQPAALSAYRDLLVFKAAGIPRILGASWDVVDVQCRTDPRTGELEHEAERLARILSADIPVDLSPQSWDLRLSDGELEAAARQLASLPPGVLPVALAPGASRETADWGEERWATLIGLLHLRLKGIGLVLLGEPAAAARAGRLAARWPGALVNLTGALTPREEAAVLARCGFLVCQQGAVMHLAASRALSCIALLGSQDRPRQWHPYGGQHLVIRDEQGIREIGVERVAEAVAAAVDRLRAPGAANSRMHSAAVPG